MYCGYRPGPTWVMLSSRQDDENTAQLSANLALGMEESHRLPHRKENRQHNLHASATRALKKGGSPLARVLVSRPRTHVFPPTGGHLLGSSRCMSFLHITLLPSVVSRDHLPHLALQSRRNRGQEPASTCHSFRGIGTAKCNSRTVTMEALASNYAAAISTTNPRSSNVPVFAEVVC